MSDDGKDNLPRVVREQAADALGLRVMAQRVNERATAFRGFCQEMMERLRVDDLPAVIEFDPGSFVLTAFGRSNAGTIRGDVQVADHYLNLVLPQLKRGGQRSRA